MEKTINQVKAAVAAAAGLLTGLWGWFRWLVAGWVACMALDYLTGSMAAAKAGMDSGLYPQWYAERQPRLR